MNVLVVTKNKQVSKIQTLQMDGTFRTKVMQPNIKMLSNKKQRQENPRKLVNLKINKVFSLLT